MASRAERKRRRRAQPRIVAEGGTWIIYGVESPGGPMTDFLRLLALAGKRCASVR